MLDRAAKAVDEARAKWRQEHNCFVHSDFDPPSELLARVVIEALREPTHEMFLAMEKNGVSFQSQQRAWPAAIDAALSVP
jgi:hypothetical protein